MRSVRRNRVPLALSPRQTAPQTAPDTEATSEPHNPDEYKVDVTAIGATMWSLGKPAMIMGAIVAIAIGLIKLGRIYL